MPGITEQSIQRALGTDKPVLVVTILYGDQEPVTIQMVGADETHLSTISGVALTTDLELYSVEASNAGRLTAFESMGTAIPAWSAQVVDADMATFQIGIPATWFPTGTDVPEFDAAPLPAAVGFIRAQFPDNKVKQLRVAVIARRGTGDAAPALVLPVADSGINFQWNVELDSVSPAASAPFANTGLSNETPLPVEWDESLATHGAATSPRYTHAVRDSAVRALSQAAKDRIQALIDAGITSASDPLTTVPNVDALSAVDLSNGVIYRDADDIAVRIQIPINRFDVVVQNHNSTQRGFVKGDTGGIVYDPSGHVATFVETFTEGTGGNQDSYRLSLSGVQTGGSPFNTGPLSILAVTVGTRVFTLENPSTPGPANAPRQWTSAAYSTRLFTEIGGLHQVVLTSGVPNSQFQPIVLHPENFVAKLANDHTLAELRAQLDGVHETLETRITEGGTTGPLRYVGHYDALTTEQRADLVNGNVVSTGDLAGLISFWIVGDQSLARIRAPSLQEAAEDNGWEILTETSHYRGEAHSQSEYYHEGDTVLVSGGLHVCITPGDFTAALIPDSDSFIHINEAAGGAALTAEQLKLLGDIPDLELKTQDIEVHTVNDWETSTDVTFKFSSERQEGAAILAGTFVSTQTWDASESIAANWCIVRVPANIDRHKVRLHQVSVSGEVSDHSINHFGLVASTGTGASAGRYYEGQIDLKNDSTITVQVDQVVGHRTEYHGRTFYDNIEGIPGHALGGVSSFVYRNHWASTRHDEQSVYLYGNAKDVHRKTLVTAIAVKWILDDSHHVPQQLRLFVGKATSTGANHVAGSADWQRASLIVDGVSHGSTATIPATTEFNGEVQGVLSTPIETDDGDILVWMAQMNFGQAAAAPGQLVGDSGTDEDSHAIRDDVSGDVFMQRAKVSWSTDGLGPPNENRNIFHSSTFSLADEIDYIDLESLRLRLDEEGTETYNGPAHVNVVGSGATVSVVNGIATLTIPGGGMVMGADGVISTMTLHLNTTTGALSATVTTSEGGTVNVAAVSLFTLIQAWARAGNNDLIPAAKHRLAEGNTRGAVGGAGTNALVDAGSDGTLRGWSAAHLARAAAAHGGGGADPFDLHDDVAQMIGAVAATDRMLLSDESESGDPNRYVTAQRFLNNILNIIGVTAADILTRSQIQDADRFVVMDASVSGGDAKTISFAELGAHFGTPVTPNPSGTDGNPLTRANVNGTNYILGPAVVSLTQAEYDALTTAQKNDATRFYAIR